MLFFVMKNMSVMLNINRMTTCFICHVIYSLITFVDGIDIFAKTHNFANAMIVLTISLVVYQGVAIMNTRGSRLETVNMINQDNMSEAIGFSIFCYEGIGIIIPVQ